jgi:hypothetical protein
MYPKLMLSVCLALVLVIIGCNAGVTINHVEGIWIRVHHPKGANSASSHTASFTDAEGRSGTRCTITLKGPEDAARRYIIEVAGSQLRINGDDYGSVNRGDSVVVSGDRVTVNDEPREPAIDDPEEGEPEEDESE